MASRWSACLRGAVSSPFRCPRLVMMNRRDCLKLLGAGGALMLQGNAALANRRPNIVFVLTDDQGYGDIHCHGNPVVKTPNMDRLHGESLRLTDYHVSPTCSPTRTAMM